MAEVKVLHCIHSLSWGGLEIYTTELIEKLATTGLQQKVLCAEQGRVAEELKKKNLANLEIITFSEKKLSKWAMARMIRRWVQKHDMNLLHSHTRLDMWACALALWDRPSNHRNIRHIYNLYMNATPKNDIVHRWLFSKVDALCSSSESLINDVRKNFPISTQKLHLIRYGRDIELFKPYPREREQLRTQYQTKPGQIIVGTLCRIDPGKGVQELAQALDYLSEDELDKIQLWIIGDPTISGKNKNGQPIYAESSQKLFQWLQQKSLEPRLQNHLIYIPFQRDYIPYIEALDVFALASYKETYSLSVLDAMMMAKPVIGTRAGGTSEQVGDNERGRLVKVGSTESLAEAIRYYLQHPEEISIQGQRAQAWSKSQHNWHLTLQQFLDLYSQK